MLTNDLLVPLLLLAGIVLGLFFMWLAMRDRNSSCARQLAELQQLLAIEKERTDSANRHNSEVKAELDKSTSDKETLRGQILADKTRIAELQATLESEQRNMVEKLALLEQAEKSMSTAFENLANRIIDEKSKKFTELNKTNIGDVLNPLREQLGDFRKKIEDVYDKETRDRVSLHHEITSLKSLNEQMSREAINLTRALKGESKTRGNWGEVILERVLEESGLKNGREYETQGSFHDEKSGKIFRPDVVVHLPDNKDVIIDSKVSLNAYERYCSSEDEQERQQFLVEHLASIRNHVADLKGKNYKSLLKINSLDMVLMFVPIEPALMLAFEKDETLFQEAFSHGIFLVSPSTLTMNLQIIHNMWRNEYQNRNAMEIARQAGAMYDKFVGFIDALEDIGDKLGRAQESYQTAHNRLTHGRGNLVKRAEDIRQLGLQPDKQISGKLLDKISDDELLQTDEKDE